MPRLNEIIFIIEMALTFSMVIIIERKFGADGLIAWTCMAAILANLQVVKTVKMFGIEATLGNVLFASVFLANDVLAEKYGENKARKSVVLSFLAVLVYLFATQVAIIYKPSENDISSNEMGKIFSFAPRVCFASAAMFFASNLLSVRIFSKIKERTKGKWVWLRNNLSTILCNCGENFAFSFLAFWGVYDLSVVLEIAISTSILETAIAICDTPFLYIATRKRKGE